jgi:hypothetical protein
MLKITSKDVQNHYGEFIESLQSELICVTRHGRSLFWAISDRQLRAEDPSMLIDQLLGLHEQSNKQKQVITNEKTSQRMKSSADLESTFDDSNQNKVSPLHYLTLSQNFLYLVKASSQAIVESGNKLVSVTKKTGDTKAEHEKQTRWSDSNLGTPLLFNFYHGLELTLKGHILGQNKKTARTHKLTELLELLPENRTNEPIRLELEKWLRPSPDSPLGQFLAKNNLKIDDWYQALKYPELSNQQLVSHLNLKYGGREAIPFWKGLHIACSQILELSVSLSKEAQYGQLPIESL